MEIWGGEGREKMGKLGEGRGGGGLNGGGEGVELGDVYVFVG